MKVRTAGMLFCVIVTHRTTKECNDQTTLKYNCVIFATKFEVHRNVSRY